MKFIRKVVTKDSTVTLNKTIGKERNIKVLREIFVFPRWERLWLNLIGSTFEIKTIKMINKKDKIKAKNVAKNIEKENLWVLLKNLNKKFPAIPWNQSNIVFKPTMVTPPWPKEAKIKLTIKAIIKYQYGPTKKVSKTEKLRWVGIPKGIDITTKVKAVKVPTSGTFSKFLLNLE